MVLAHDDTPRYSCGQQGCNSHFISRTLYVAHTLKHAGASIYHTRDDGINRRHIAYVWIESIHVSILESRCIGRNIFTIKELVDIFYLSTLF